MRRHTSAIVSLIVSAGMAGSAATMAAHAAGVNAPPSRRFTRSVVLDALSAQVKDQLDREVASRVEPRLDLRFGARARYLTPEELRTALGSSDEPIESVAIHGRQGVKESPLQAAIPYGLGGIAWGIRHPSQAWRTAFPVLD